MHQSSARKILNMFPRFNDLRGSRVLEICQQLFIKYGEFSKLAGFYIQDVD